MDDKEIIELFFARSEKAIVCIQKKYGKLLKKLAMSILNNHEDAEECENEVYLTVWNNIPPEKPNSLSAYACRICRNIALNLKKKNNTKKRRGNESDLILEEISEQIPASKNLEEEYDELVLKKLINSFLEALDADKRKVFIGRYYFFDSVKCISQKTGLSVKKIRIMLDKLKEDFAEYLRKEGYYEE